MNIKDGPTFEIVSTKTKGALSISVLDYAGISEKSRGVIGHWTQMIWANTNRVKQFFITMAIL